MSSVTIVGNLGTDPELRFTPAGDAVAKFSVGESRRVKGADGTWTDGPTSWHDVSAWRHLAEHVAESCSKGTRVIIVGELEQRSWEDKDTGKRRYAWQVTARHVGVDLTFGSAKFTKSAKQGAPVDPSDPWATASRARPPAPAAAGGGYSDEPPF